MKLTAEILMKGTGCTADVAGIWLAPMQAACDKFGITTAKSVAAFLANVGVESNGLTNLVENVNYSASRLAVVWPHRYALNAFSVNKVPNETALRIGGNPVLVASNVYADRLGNGPEYTQDGYKYRGQGPIQLTGKAKIQTFFTASGLSADSDPSQLQKPELGAMSAAWFFANSGALDFADQGNFDMTVCRVNGQAPCPANQGDRRRALYNSALPLCTAAETPLKPAPVAPAKTTASKASQPAASNTKAATSDQQTTKP